MQDFYCYLVFSNKKDGENIYQNYFNENGELDYFKLIPITLDDVKNLDEKWGGIGTAKLEYDSETNMIEGVFKGGIPYSIFEEISKKSSEPISYMVEGIDNYYYQSVITYNKGEKLEEKFFDLDLEKLGDNASEEDMQKVYDELVDEKYHYTVEKLNEINKSNDYSAEKE